MPESNDTSDNVREEFLKELESKAQEAGSVALLFESLGDSSSEDEDSEAEEQTRPQVTLEQLRGKKYALVTQSCSAHLERIQERMEREGAPRGFQSTSTCASMYRVFSSELRRANGSFDNLLALTLAFKEDDGRYCFHDTDIPEEAQKLLSRFGKMWQDAMQKGLPLDDHSREGVIFMLQQFQKSIHEMDADYKFTYAPHVTTPPKRGRTSAAVPGSDEKPPQKRPRHEKAMGEKCLSAPTGKLAGWLHGRDHELKTIQDAALQIICKEEGGKNEARALVISASHPLRSLSNTLGAAFALEGVIFDPHQNKGHGPDGAKFVAGVDDEAPAQLPASLKVVQALQERGNSLKYTVGDRAFEITLDGVVSNKADFRIKNSTHLPRCVGADKKAMGKIDKLNTLFMASRQPGNFVMCSKTEARKATIKAMSIPLTLSGTPQSRCLLSAPPREGPMTL